jgi:hypothetical protein
MVTATERGSGLWLPHTERHPINQLDVGPRAATRGVVLHINEGTFEGTLSWWSRPGNNVGAHIEVGDGRVAQCVALEREAFHAEGGHPDCPGPHFPLDVWLRLCHDAYYGHWGRR